MSKNSKTNFFLFSAMAFWGLGTVLTKIALNNFSFWVLLPFQLACSAVFLGVLLFVVRKRDSSSLHFRLNGKVALLGVLNPGIAYALGLSGLSRIPASISVVLWAVEPLLITLMAFLFIRESVNRVVVLAVVIATFGVVLIVGQPDGHGEMTGIILTLAAVGACAGYSIVLSLMKVRDGSLHLVFVQQLAATVFALVLMTSQFVVRGLPRIQFPPLKVAEAAIAGLLYYGLAFWMYVSGLRRTNAAKAGTFLTLIPVFGLVFSVILLKEHLSRYQFLGSAIVVGAVVSVSFYERRHSETPTIAVGGSE